eukprot:2543716-Alexandrium_andersonii.AAC.1
MVASALWLSLRHGAIVVVCPVGRGACSTGGYVARGSFRQRGFLQQTGSQVRRVSCGRLGLSPQQVTRGRIRGRLS